MDSRLNLIVLFLLLVADLPLTWGQQLVAVEARAKLPTPRNALRAVYDGDDKVYIFGGESYFIDRFFHDDILEYSITDDSISVIGHLPLPLAHGAAVWGNGSAYYFGGFGSGGYNLDVFEFTPGMEGIRSVAGMESSLIQTDAAWDGEDNAYILPAAGDSRFMHRFTQSTAELAFVATHNYSYNFGKSAAFDYVNKNLFYFGGWYETYGNGVYKFSPEEDNIELIPTRLPWRAMEMSSVFDGKNIIVLGGRNEGLEATGVAYFNPVTYQFTLLSVANFPLQYAKHGAVYVEKLKRVYLFGGSSVLQGQRDKILYIDFTNAKN